VRDNPRMAQIFLRELADFPGMNEAWDAWVPAGHTPPLSWTRLRPRCKRAAR
jgi:hypothetical protein